MVSWIPFVVSWIPFDVEIKVDVSLHRYSKACHDTRLWSRAVEEPDHLTEAEPLVLASSFMLTLDNKLATC
jgi:hypothetical protein